MIVRYIRWGVRFLPLLAIVLLVVEILVTNELAGFGRKVSETDRAIDAIREENQLLQEKVASLSALTTIEEKARAYGFVTSPSAISVGTEHVAFQLQP
ncbi:hypothetical protein HY949_00700 [Candidatus Gottesmanbacteria bacterium]|nr:hypothetical protein [Candidatus Gottesmanbacteria bacterium]